VSVSLHLLRSAVRRVLGTPRQFGVIGILASLLKGANEGGGRSPAGGGEGIDGVQRVDMSAEERNSG